MSHTKLKTVATAISLAVAACTLPLEAKAGATIEGFAPVYGTGQNLTTGSRDSRWVVVAAPSDCAPSKCENPPYDSYVLTQYSVINGNIFNSIGFNFDGSDPFGDSQSRNWIFKQDFSVSQAGTYSLELNGYGDNGLSLFLGGTLGITSQSQPTISGGIPIDYSGDPNQTVYLQAGINSLYAVLTDYGGSAAFALENPNVPANNVPAPLPIFGAAAAFGASRRLKRRIRLARLTAPERAEMLADR